jgi:hypothetical protein
MDTLDEELLRFWRVLNAHGVRYIMVGGLATRFHGYNRTTDDLDLWLDDTLVNRQHLRKAFAELGYGDYSSIETMQFVPGWTTFYAAGIELDIMTEMKGVEASFEECYQMASISRILDVQIPFLHINHLIANKKAVNRPKDQMDVTMLEKIRDMKTEIPGTGS